MKSKIIIISIFSFLIFIGLIGYNYFVAQKRIKETRPAPLSINLVSYPETLKAGNTGTFIWNVDASTDLSSNQTTIFWGLEASPSALALFDSPDAVGYPNHQADYFTGSFILPDTFDTNIKFEKAGKIYFRAYAKVGKDHLWTEEKSIVISQ